jgi:hypothetical protein
MGAAAQPSIAAAGSSARGSRSPESVAPAGVGPLDEAPGGAEDEAAARLARGFSDQPTRGEALPGEAARTANDAFSLDRLFRPSVPSGGAGNFSFDEFFANGQPGAPPSAEPQSEQEKAKDDSGETDLDAFNAWLEGLKR